MAALLEFTNYLEETFGLKAEVEVLPPKKVPVFISETYTFWRLKIGEARFLGVVLRSPESFKPISFEKHRPFFEKVGSEHIVVIADRLSGFVRKRFIEMRVPFVVPGVQLYWPELGLEFRNHVKGKIAPQAAIESFDPATQAVLIGALNDCYQCPVTPKELSQQLHYSAMTMTRALDNLEATGIGKVEKSGKKRLLSFPEDKRFLWEQARPKFINPVRETARFWEKDIPDSCKLLAGESALSEVSALVAPQTATYAVGREKWKKIENRAIQDLDIPEPETCEVQVWRYDPELFSRNHVDLFSLFLSMESNKDERIEMALDEALEARL